MFLTINIEIVEMKIAINCQIVCFYPSLMRLIVLSVDIYSFFSVSTLTTPITELKLDL